MKATELDKKFDAGEDMTDFLDLSQAKRPGLEIKQVGKDMNPLAHQVASTWAGEGRATESGEGEGAK